MNRDRTTTAALKVRAHLGRADVLALIGEYARAKGDYSTAQSKAVTPESQIAAYLGLAEVEGMRGDFDSAISLSNKAAIMAKEQNFDVAQIRALNSKSMLLYRKGAYKASKRLSEQCLATLRTIRAKNKAEDVKKETATALNNMGNVFFDTSQYEKAINAYQKALSIQQAINNKKAIGVLYNNIGIVYRKLKNPDDSIKFYKKAAAVFSRIGDRFGEIGVLTNLGVAYSDLSDVNYKKVHELFERARAFAESIGNETVVVWILNNIGALQIAQQQPDKALHTYGRALNMAEKKNDRTMVDMICGNMAEIFFNLGDYQNAINSYQRCLKIKKTIFGEKSTVDILFRLTNIELEQGKLKSVLHRFQLLKELLARYKLHDRNAALSMIQGDLHAYHKNFQRAEISYREALKYYQQSGEDEGISRCLSKIALNILGEGEAPLSSVKAIIANAKHHASKAKSDEALFLCYASCFEFSIRQKNGQEAMRYLEKLRLLAQKPALGRFYPHYLFASARAHILQGKSANRSLNEAMKYVQAMDLKPLQRKIKKFQDRRRHSRKT